MTLKQTLFSLAVLLLSSPVFGQSWGTWQTETPMPTGGLAKTHATGLEVGGTMFILGGPPWMNPPDEDPTVFSMPIGGSVWTEEIGFDGLGYVLGQSAGVDALGRIIVFGGDDPTEPGSFDKPPFEWNQIEGPWRDIASRGALAPLTGFASCTDDTGRIYSFGGGNGVGASSSSYAERYLAITDEWEPIAPLPVPVRFAAASPDGLGHILVFGGVLSGGFTRTNLVQQYDIAADTWTTTVNSAMPVALSYHEATLGADGRVYILGGSTDSASSTTQSTSRVYNPENDQWLLGPEMSVPRRLFASFLGSDDRIYVAGGENASGGTNAVESIYTTPCAVFSDQPLDLDLWANTTLSLKVGAAGGGTIEYRWTRDDLPLEDGPSVGGGQITGAHTNQIEITSIGALDAGAYVAIATNACGDVESQPTAVAVQVPPAIPTQWTWTSLHPSYAESSRANGIDNGVQVGNAVFDTPDYNNIDHPTVWTGTAASAQNLTPAGSQGGNIVDFKGDKLVGWWWKPTQCYVSGRWLTCYYRRGAWWNLDGTFHETNYSGYEYTSMSATDGVSIVGSGSTDDTVGNVFTRGVIWQAPTHEFALSVHPSGYTDSSLGSVDGEYQFGSVSLPFQGLHAGMWKGSAASFVDMHPPQFVNSRISDASDGQQVGTVNIWNNPQAVLWAGTPDSLTTLHPDAATSSTVSKCEGGLQLGTVIFPDSPTAVLGMWAGSKDTFTELNIPVPANYTGFSAASFDIAPDGTISIVGAAVNQVLGRSEAILVTSTTTPPCPADIANAFGVLGSDGTVDFGDFLALLGLVGICPGVTPGCTGDIADGFGVPGGDGIIDFGDFLAMLANIGDCP